MALAVLALDQEVASVGKTTLPSHREIPIQWLLGRRAPLAQADHHPSMEPTQPQAAVPMAALLALKRHQPTAAEAVVWVGLVGLPTLSRPPMALQLPAAAARLGILAMAARVLTAVIRQAFLLLTEMPKRALAAAAAAVVSELASSQCPVAIGAAALAYTEKAPPGRETMAQRAVAGLGQQIKTLERARGVVVEVAQIHQGQARSVLFGELGAHSPQQTRAMCQPTKNDWPIRDKQCGSTRILC